jgi:tetratricopeptide (TPR) repeat protein
VDEYQPALHGTGVEGSESLVHLSDRYRQDWDRLHVARARQSRSTAQRSPKSPDLQTIHFAIGNLYWRRALLDEAPAELRKELKVSPNDPQAHYEIGDILFSQEQSEEAEKHFEQAIRYAPSMAEAHLAIERIANVKGDSDKALAHLKKAAEITPEDPTPQYCMWVLYRRLGKPEEARVARAAFEARKDQNQSKTALKP